MTVRTPGRFGVVVGILVMVSGPSGAADSSPALPLAADGRALQPIVLCRDATPQLRELADELATYLNRITGAAFPIQTGDGRRGIVVGTLQQFPQPDLEKPLAMNGPYDGKEAYAIRTEP
ncbi:MAG TPA: hypothetical protein EYP14_07670, partial [Planctomycetaceae bacterium]|nr:hypothetical protein [Planctomycetaceae bacterium]